MSVALRVDSRRRAEVEQTVGRLVSDLVASRLSALDPSLWPTGTADDALMPDPVDAVTAARAVLPDVARLRREQDARGAVRTVVVGTIGVVTAAAAVAATAAVDLTTLPLAMTPLLPNVLTAGGGPVGTTLIVCADDGDDAARALDAAASVFEDAGLDPAHHVIVVAAAGSAGALRARHDGMPLLESDTPAVEHLAALDARVLVAAGVAGCDVDEIVDEADAALLEIAVDHDDNPALILAAAIGQADTVGVLTDGSHIAGFEDWAAHLLAGLHLPGVLAAPLLPVSPEVEAPAEDLRLVRIVEDAGSHRSRSDRRPETLISGSLGGLFVVWARAASVLSVLHGTRPWRLLPRHTPAAAPAVETRVVDGVRIAASVHLPGADLATVLASFWGVVADHGRLILRLHADRAQAQDLIGLRELVAAATGRPVAVGWGPDLDERGTPDRDAALLIAGADAEPAVVTADADSFAVRGIPTLTLSLTADRPDPLVLYTAVQKESPLS